jgi:Spy/CpxP family protein refolding chaperone
MRTRPFTLLASAIALTFTFASVPATFAQSSSPVPTQQAAPNSAPESTLTSEQQSQIKQIKRSAFKQIQAVLTSQQIEQIKAAKARGEDRKQIMSSLKLTPDQQTRIQNIRKNTKQQISAIQRAS